MSPSHDLTEIDADAKRGVCSVCGPVPLQRSAGRYWRCAVHGTQTRRRRAAARLRRLGAFVCSRCGFVAVTTTQIDAHHRDGNHKNNDPANIETLCANCHRLAHGNGAVLVPEQTVCNPDHDGLGAPLTLRLTAAARTALLAAAERAAVPVHSELRAAIDYWLKLPPPAQQAERVPQRKKQARRQPGAEPAAGLPPPPARRKEWIARPENKLVPPPGRTEWIARSLESPQ